MSRSQCLFYGFLAIVWMFYESVSSAFSASDDLNHWPDTGRDSGHRFAASEGCFA